MRYDDVLPMAVKDTVEGSMRRSAYYSQPVVEVPSVEDAGGVWKSRFSLFEESLRAEDLLSCLHRCQAWPGAIIAYRPHILTIDQVPVKLCWDHSSARKSSPKGSYHSCVLRKRKGSPGIAVMDPKIW